MSESTKPSAEGSARRGEKVPPDPNSPENLNTPPKDRPPSPELTMFSPYNSFKNFESSGVRGMEESVTVQEKGESKGGARVFFSRLFSSGSSNQISQTTSTSSASPTKPANQKGAMPPAAGASGVGPSRGESSSKTAEVEQRKVLVKPVKGGTANLQKQAPQTLGVANKKPPSSQSAGSSKAPPPKQPQRGVAKWNSRAENVTTSVDSSDIQLSLSSYARPRHMGPLASQGSQPAKVGGKSGQADRRNELLTRFGQIESDQSGADLKKYWMPDDACKECSDCGTKFSLFVRRHHCRICGRIYCHTCCSLTIPAAELRPNLQGNLRVCKECKNIFRDFHSRRPKQDSPLLSSEGQRSDSSPLSPRLSVTMTPVKGQAVSGDPQPSMPNVGGDVPVLKSGSGTFNRMMSTSRPASILSPHKSWDEASGRSQELDMSPSRLGEFDMYHTLRRRTGLTGLTGFDSLTAGQRDDSLLELDEDELEEIVTRLWLKLLDPETGLQRQNHRYRLRTFPNTYSAHQLVEWLVTNKHVRSREVAIRVGQALVNTKRLKIVSMVDSYFRDDSNMFLELGEAAELLPDDSESPLLTDAPNWFLRLREDEEVDRNAEQWGEPNKEFIHVPPLPDHQSTPEKGLATASIALSVADKRKSRGISYSSLGRGEFEDEYEYLVIDEDQNAREKKDSSHLTINSSANRPSTPNHHSFSMIGKDELVQSIPVEGLSAATEAAKECSEENSKLSVPKDKAFMHYELVHSRHFNALMTQTMKRLGLNLKWLDILRPLVMEASRNVRTDMFTNDLMDINQYVKIKKIPRGYKSESTLVYGVVCSKNVTHKKMSQSIKNPKILLLKCAFEFQRKENQLSSFDTLQLQEKEYLKNLVVKVNAIKPNLILVQKSVSRLALEMLQELGIVVAVNVKPSVMNRVARCTKGEILSSLDQLMFGTSTIFGTCGQFYIKNFLLADGIKKTLMYFDNCPPEFGCVITLQGAPLKELKKVKKVTQFGLHIAYNAILETHFLVDEFAWPSEEEDHQTSSTDYSPSCLTPEWPLYPSLGYPMDSITTGELQKKLEALKFVEIEENANLEDGEQPQEIVPSVEECPASPLLEKQVDDSEEVEIGEEVVCTVDVEPSPASSVGPDKVLATVEEREEEVVDEARAPTESDHTPPESGEIQPAEGEADTQSLDVVSVQEDPGLIMVDPLRPFGWNITDKQLHKFAEEEFKLAQRNHILSVSPFVQFKTPYLQTPQGRSADSRQYMPNIIYWSYLFKPRNLLKNSQRLSSKSSHLEMGLTKCAIQSSGGTESGQPNTENESLALNSAPSPPSYKSVSAHPFTKSIFLAQANTNEMRAALADFRARAGYHDENDTFLFQSAKRAADYQLYLDSVFSNCREFEEAAAALEELPAHSQKEASKASSGRLVVRAKRNWFEKEFSKSRERNAQLKARDPFRRLMAGKGARKTDATRVKPDPKTDDSSSKTDDSADSKVNKDIQEVSKNDTQVSKGDTVVSDDIEPSSPSVIVVQDEEGVTLSTEVMEPLSQESGSDEDGGVAGKPLSRAGGSFKNRDSGGLKLGTLDDFDRNNLRSKVEKEEEAMADSNYETWLAAEEQVDCFDPVNHQGISILFSNTAHDGNKHQVPCVAPCVIPMFYYGRNDISLGEFLHRYCFRPFYRCQTCGAEMIYHQRHVIHALSAIHISMQQLVSPLPNDGYVYTWLACKYCSDMCTPYTRMSKDSLLFSFAKFLELKFYCETYMTRYHVNSSSTCDHSLHKDYVQYFLHKDKIAAFQPDIVGLLEVLLPPQFIAVSTPRRGYHVDFKTEIKHIQRIIEGVFYQIGQKLEKYRLEPVAHSIDDHIANSKAERDALRSKVRQLKDLVVSGCTFDAEADKAKLSLDFVKEADIIQNLQDNVADLKRCIVDVVDCWNIHLEELDVRARDYRRKLRERDSAQGESSRDSPATIAPPTNSTPTQITPPQSVVTTVCEQSRSSPGHTPYGTPPGSPNSDSIDFSQPTLPSANLLAEGSHAPSDKNSTRDRGHSRNLSDSGLLDPQGDKTHKRQLSDSGTVQASRNLSSTMTTPCTGSEARLSSIDALTNQSSAPSLSELAEEGDSLKEVASDEGKSPKEGVSSVGAPGEVTVSTESEQMTKEEVKTTEPKQRNDALVEGKGIQIPKLSSEKDEETQPDSTGGILARFRGSGKEPQEARDDPNKFYLLDPYMITTAGGSPVLNRIQPPASHATSPIPEPQQKSGRKLSAAQKKASLAHASTESHSESKGEKRGSKDKERVGVLSRPFQRLPNPFPNSEHHTMHSIITIPISIYEQEPTSIIAFALSSREYMRKLAVLQERVTKMGGALAKVIEVKPTRAQATTSPKSMRKQISDAEKGPPPGANATTLKTNFKAVLNELKKKGSAISLFSGSASISTNSQTSGDAFDPSTDSSARRSEFSSSYNSRSHDPSVQSSRSADLILEGTGSTGGGASGPEEVDSGKATPHISLEFTNTDKSASFFCKVYYAEEFRKLRKLIFPSGEDRFIRSLSRCVKYDAKGGKSRSTFCKVSDDRFILKQVKSIEISSFEFFAPHYLQHVTKALEEKRPLTLAKILGAYSIGFRNSKSGSSKRLDVLVMENLLYGHTTSKVFDLKGSMRSRFIDPSKESSGDVLLDENYLNSICCNPVYVYPHSKCVLMQAILADSEFLAQNAIMDYSLLTCIDESTGELVVGIIDYIRTFTLDKRLEMYLKKTAGKVLPTVVYPELYRKRFCDAMDRYFTVVPDKWTGLGADVKFL